MAQNVSKMIYILGPKCTSYNEISKYTQLALRPVPGMTIKVNQFEVQNYDRYGQCNQK